MIEIAFDKNEENTYQNRLCPTYRISLPDSQNFAAYRHEAQKLLTTMRGTPTLIIDDKHVNYSRNMFAVALFVEAYKESNGVECAIFKIKNYEKELNEYKPYIALTVGLKFVMLLHSAAPDEIYHEISELGYLGLEIKKNFVDNKLFLVLNGTEPPRKIITTNTSQALITIGILKTLALAHANASLSVEMQIDNTPPTQALDDILEEIIKGVSPWISTDLNTTKE